VRDAVSGVKLYEGEPGRECGHSVRASSYFDRLWKRGISKHSEVDARFYLCLAKEGGKEKGGGASGEEGRGGGEGKKRKDEGEGKGGGDGGGSSKKKKKSKG
jgi:hypothetical protein